MPTNIPKARELIQKAVPYIDDVEARSLVLEALGHMTRKVKPNPRTIGRKITKEIFDGVLAMHGDSPHLTYMEIAEHFQINPGRVSEIINGVRKPPEYSTPGDGMNRRM